jgi:hypothetical protein
VDMLTLVSQRFENYFSTRKRDLMLLFIVSFTDARVYFRGMNSFSALLGDSSSQDLTALYHQFVEMVYIVKGVASDYKLLHLPVTSILVDLLVMRNLHFKIRLMVSILNCRVILQQVKTPMNLSCDLIIVLHCN